MPRALLDTAWLIASSRPLRLLGRAVLIAFGMMCIAFALVRMLPGDPVSILLGENATQDSTLIQADLTEHAEVQRVAREALAFAPIDILINNAGHVVRRVHWTELDPAHLDRVFNLNYRAPLYLTQLLSPSMIERGKGVIVNTLSTTFVSGGTACACWPFPLAPSTPRSSASRTIKPTGSNGCGPSHSAASVSRPRSAKSSLSWCPTRQASSLAKRSTSTAGSICHERTPPRGG